MAEEIRPGYYKSASPKYRSVLAALGFKPWHFETECVEAWQQLNLQYCAPATHAVKYLWRCGQKGDEAEDIAKAMFWLIRAQIMIDEINISTAEFDYYLRRILPKPSAFENAIALLEDMNGPTI